MELSLRVSTAKPDIMMLRETWLCPDISDGEIQPPSYTLFRSDFIRGRCGGIAVYLSEVLGVQPQ